MRDSRTSSTMDPVVAFDLLPTKTLPHIGAAGDAIEPTEHFAWAEAHHQDMYLRNNTTWI